MKTIAIAGGGITGLSTAYYLQRELASGGLAARVVVLEASPRLGGKIATVQDGGFTMETGADSIVARKENVAPFIEDMGLTGEVVYNATGKSYIYIDGGLKKIPEDSVFGIPLSLQSLAESTLISAEGKVEALKDYYTPEHNFTFNDSIGLFLESCLGKEIVERQIAPVLSGVYSGKLHDLTIASTLPYLLTYKNEYGSLLKGLSENKQKYKSAGNAKFISFGDGVSALIDTLEKRLAEVEIRKSAKLERISRSEGRYRLSIAGDEALNADYVVLSTDYTAAQRMLQDKELDTDFSQLKNSSLISVYAGFDIPDSELPNDGTGFITADHSGLACDACTWTSRKWTHTSKEHKLLVRLFYKSSNPRYSELKHYTAEQLVQTALRDIQLSLGITAEPVTVQVTPWRDAMPNYHIRHHEIVKSLENKLAERYPGIMLAGCSYYGVGIPDCIANGQQTAEAIIHSMRQQQTEQVRA
ncbi:protoporphyrinogen oxidase [Paenibacillus protaetiae]|uniref:Coproporphyrinogen III oxidase n=1 Tax=Paenibacillus protaetiae TaxID=2509456 RepID=A0A4P6ESG1_9BACL|nr:protoporphyrinogen oxidase [Paenibacillus protaetiae]QAY65872.1 protoporphyrinogen oxidase [Paenibacillus protaetiae]